MGSTNLSTCYLGPLISHWYGFKEVEKFSDSEEVSQMYLLYPGLLPQP